MELYINDRIRTRKVEFFSNFVLTLRYDAVASTFGFDFYFNENNIELKELACVGHDHICQLKHNGELLLTGYILNENFDDQSERSLISFAGYSKCGAIEDCNIPPEFYPLQSNKLSLKQIAEKFTASPFDFKVKIDPLVQALMDEVIPETTAKATQTIKSYLSELASQKNIVLSHTVNGDLYFTRAKANQKPLVYFESGQPGFPHMSLNFNGQAMHSHITVIKDADEDGGNAGQSTIQNPYVPFVFRPKVISQTSGDDIDTDKAAENALAEELRNLRIEIDLDKWEIDGKIIKPNSMISVKNPAVYLYNKTNLFVEAVTLRGNSKQLTASISCVVPEVYNNQKAKYLFSGINLH